MNGSDLQNNERMFIACLFLPPKIEITLLTLKSTNSNSSTGSFEMGSSVFMLLFDSRMPRIFSKILLFVCSVSKVVNRSCSDILFDKLTTKFSNSLDNANFSRSNTSGTPSQLHNFCIFSLIAFVYFLAG